MNLLHQLFSTEEYIKSVWPTCCSCHNKELCFMCLLWLIMQQSRAFACLLWSKQNKAAWISYGSLWTICTCKESEIMQVEKGVLPPKRKHMGEKSNKMIANLQCLNEILLMMIRESVDYVVNSICPHVLLLLIVFLGVFIPCLNRWQVLIEDVPLPKGLLLPGFDNVFCNIG